MERVLQAYLPGGKFQGTTAQHSKTMQAVRGKNNRTTEKRLRFGLVRRGIDGWKVRPRGLRGNPDFFFPAARVAIFVDGCFWHGCDACGHVPRKNSDFWATKISRNRKRDKKTSRGLKRQGVHVLRFWEHQLQKDLNACIEEIVLSLATMK